MLDLGLEDYGLVLVYMALALKALALTSCGRPSHQDHDVLAPGRNLQFSFHIIPHKRFLTSLGEG